jgi:hypothetical protein
MNKALATKTRLAAQNCFAGNIASGLTLQEAVGAAMVAARQKPGAPDWFSEWRVYSKRANYKRNRMHVKRPK